MTVMPSTRSLTPPSQPGDGVALQGHTILPDGSGQRIWSDGTEEVWDAFGNHLIDHGDGRSETRDVFGNRCILYPTGAVEHIRADGGWDWVDAMGAVQSRPSHAMAAEVGWKDQGMVDLSVYRRRVMPQDGFLGERPAESVLDDVISLLRS